MARAEELTLLPLDRFAKLISIDPLLFNGIILPAVHNDSQAQRPWFQYGWQSNLRLSREEAAQAIAEAELSFAREAGYWPQVNWVQDERHAVPRPLQPQTIRTNTLNPRGQHITARMDYRYTISGGQRAATLIAAASVITWAAANATTGWATTGTVTVTSAVDPCEIHVFYAGHAGDPLWEIRPVDISVSGTTVTITINRELAVLEALLERVSINIPDPDIHGGIDGTDDANFESTVDVYRVWNDPQSQVNLEWEPDPIFCDCGQATCVVCSIAFQSGCLIPRGDTRDGFFAFAPATWDATTEAFATAALAVGRDPDWVRIWYRSGWEWKAPNASCTRRNMDPRIERIIARLATAYLPRSVHTKEKEPAMIDYWREDLARVDTSGSHQLGARVTENPWGTTRAAVWAWQQMKSIETGRAVLT